jgi:hypothetical protein
VLDYQYELRSGFLTNKGGKMKRISMIAMMVLAIGLLSNGCELPQEPSLHTFYGTVFSVDEDFTVVIFNQHVIQEILNNGEKVVQREDIHVEVRFFTDPVERELVEGQNVFAQYWSRKRFSQGIFRKRITEDIIRTFNTRNFPIHVLP